MENAATTNQEQRISRVGAIHKPRKFKIAKMWGLFINRENSNFAKFKTAKLEKQLYTGTGPYIKDVGNAQGGWGKKLDINCRHYFVKTADIRGEGSKSSEKLPTSFMFGPLQIILSFQDGPQLNGRALDYPPKGLKFEPWSHLKAFV